MGIHGAKSRGTDSATNIYIVEKDEKVLSQHRFRSQRRAAMREAKDEKMLKIQFELGQLKYVVQSQAEELQSWRAWYASVCSEAQIVQDEVANNMFERMGEKEVRVDTNYEMDVNEDINTDSGQSDPFCLLAAMASDSYIAVAGATILPGDCSAPNVEFEGESLLNRIHVKRIGAEVLVSQAMWATIAAIALPPHVFSIGDVVYAGKELSPYSVKRIGHGDYLQQVRIIKLGVPDTYEAGKWISHGSLYLLEIGDKLEAFQSVVDATNELREISAGTSCRFDGFDEDGDVLVSVHPGTGTCWSTTIFFEDFAKFSLL